MNWTFSFRTPASAFAVWFAGLASPVACFIGIIFLNKSAIAASLTVLVCLFFLMPPLGLLVSGWALWTSKIDLPRKIIFSLLTFLAMAFEFAVLVTILAVVTQAAIAYAQ